MNIKIIIKLTTCLFFIGLLALGILFTKIDMPFSISFLIPIIYFSVQKEASSKYLLILSIFASVVWMITNSLSADKSLDLIVILYSFLRFGIYFSISYLMMQFKKQRVELSRKNLELGELNNEKNIIIGTAAHDIRNAAGAIFSFSQILLQNLESKNNVDKNLKITSIINKASENLLNMVTNILDLSKIESGQIHLNKIFTDYNSFVQERIDLLDIIAQNKNIRVSFEKSEDLLEITFDPIYLTEVIDNFISNAIKYSNTGSEIKVLVKKLEKFVLTEVIDNGIGIRDSELKLLFKPFSKTSSAPTGGEASSGLGLAIAQKVVKLHGGEIGVESVINKGSRFYFTLPI